MLKPAEISEIIRTILHSLPVNENLEVTLEANPGTVGESDIAAYVNAGVNRLSIGVQALDDSRLQFLGRIHSTAQTIEIFKIIRKRENLKVSVDLMVGTPLESAQSWDRELNTLLRYHPDGISFYSLTLEEGTKLAERAEQGERVHLTSDQTVDLLLHVAGRLKETGYRHYEVSNWALPASESQHNIHYWKRGSYIGLGPSAHSFNDRLRKWNVPDLKAYCASLADNKLPPSDSEELTDEEIKSEWVYLNLRQSDGLSLREFLEVFGEAPNYWGVMFQKIAQKGFGEFDGNRFQPNDRGLLLADEIAARILG